MEGAGSHTTPHDGGATEMVKAVTMSMEHRYWISRASSMCSPPLCSMADKLHRCVFISLGADKLHRSHSGPLALQCSL